jgi:hypothetical protein
MFASTHNLPEALGGMSQNIRFCQVGPLPDASKFQKIWGFMGLVATDFVPQTLFATVIYRGSCAGRQRHLARAAPVHVLRLCKT